MTKHTAISPSEAADRLAIRELVETYAHCADRRDAKGQMSLFTADTHFVVYMNAKDPTPSQELHSREALALVFADLNQYAATTHFVGQSTILTLTGDRAKGEAYCLAHHVTVNGGKRSLMLASLRYLDTFVKMDGAWLFVTALVRAQRAEESLRTVQAELAHVSRVTTLGQLTASIAHEITQPIASARNNARAALNFLGQQPPELNEVREALSCVVGDADRAGDIIDRIRDHIKKSPPRKARFDLNATINEVLVLARSAINENGVSVKTRLAEGLLPVHGDRVQLQQVVLNLILNAVEAMGLVEAGERDLLISTEPNQTGGVLLAVRDSGPGIDPEHLERVFEAFYTTKSSGVGMGLSICRSIIDAHGGRLWADVNEPRGAAFRFTLPAAEDS
jgi:C4-dicarboxylate-specific signal transduction histidine kinase